MATLTLYALVNMARHCRATLTQQRCVVPNTTLAGPALIRQPGYVIDQAALIDVTLVMYWWTKMIVQSVFVSDCLSDKYHLD